ILEHKKILSDEFSVQKIFLKRFSCHQNFSENFVAPKTSESFRAHPKIKGQSNHTRQQAIF
ncbi:MAG: hypothetical protein Q8N99_08255, partial [Nanoarchaeota archaeon]|nr:hypothetical protein [Nanoarchaeota archaeon]